MKLVMKPIVEPVMEVVMDPIIFHIDVNSAYLSWTALERLAAGDPTDLRLIPSIIGGDTEKRHGVVLAKSIPAKKYGIQTGEPVVSAFRKCPSLVMAPPDHELYARRSHALMEHLAGICPDIEQVSVDECYMDYTPIARLYASPIEGARMIRETVRQRFGFTVNVGISDRKVLAKMASDFQKPDLTHTLFASEIQTKLWQLPVSALFMCGRASAETLHKLELLTIGDLAHADPAILEAHLKSHGRLLWEYANGIDASQVLSEPVRAKGIGNSTTLSQDATTAAAAKEVLLALSESVAARLRSAMQRAQMVSVEIKYADFQTVSHQTTFQTPTDSANAVYQAACQLFDETWNQAPIRLLGVRTARLCPASDPVQLSLFDLAKPPIAAAATALPDAEKQHRLDAAIDAIRQKYGDTAVVRGSLLGQQHFKK